MLPLVGALPAPLLENCRHSGAQLEVTGWQTAQRTACTQQGELAGAEADACPSQDQYACLTAAGLALRAGD